MKRFVCLVCGCWLFVSAMAQTPSLFITTDKTTSLIFPFSIRHVDRGSRDVLVQQVKEADNILLVKAALKDFSETNLSVVTDGGNVYSFMVRYDSKPPVWIYNLPVNNKATLATYANGILDNQRTMHGIRDHKWDMYAIVKGIYIKDNIFFYQLQITNESPIDYDVDVFRFYIRDKKKSKRTATQEIELKPLYLAGNDSQIKAGSNSVIVVALEKFTIPDAKYLLIEIGEKNGGRHLRMKINNAKLLRAKILPSYH